MNAVLGKARQNLTRSPSPHFSFCLLNEDVAGKYRVTKELSDRLDSSLGGTCLEPSGYKQDADDRVFLDKVVNLGEKT